MTSSIVVERTLKASCERVFAAWTRPELMAEWFYADPGWSVQVQADVRVGGLYRLEMRDEHNAVHVQHGEYKVIEPVSMLVFTWSCPEIGVHDSIVTLQLEATGSATAFRLTHTNLPSDAGVRRRHEDGWAGCLGNLDRFLTSIQDTLVPHAHTETIHANATPAAAYDALTTQAGYRAWWAKDCD